MHNNVAKQISKSYLKHLLKDTTVKGKFSSFHVQVALRYLRSVAEVAMP